MEVCNATQRWIIDMQVMIGLLDAEFSALKEKDQTNIIRLSQEKTALLAQIEHHEQTIFSALRAQEDEALHIFVQLSTLCGETPSKQLQTLAREAQQANQRNGALLQAMIRLNEHALNLLTGKQAKVSTYSASGHIESSVSTLTKLATA